MSRWPILDNLSGFRLTKDALGSVLELVNPYIEEHEKSLDTKNVRDFLDVLLCEQKTGQEGISSLTGRLGSFTIVNSLIDLFVAGMETTSSSLVMAILQLLHHPEVQQKVQQELDQVGLLQSTKIICLN